MSERRAFFKRLASLGATFWAGGKAALAQHHHEQERPTGPARRNASGQPAGIEQGVARGKTRPPSSPSALAKPAFNIPVETPDLPKLPYKIVDGWKEFHLIAEVVRTELVPGRVMDAWGFNGSVPGPTIEVNQGDKVRVIFENRLPEMSAVHWHGFEVPMEMDGSVGLGQDPVPPGGKFIYEWELHQAGTFFYHSHFAMQEMMGMLGLFIMHPKEPYRPHCDRDFGIILQEWALLPNNTVPNTLAMEFNWLTFNGKSGPATTAMIVKQGERVRIRLINIGMDHHPIHLHGHQFVVTGTEGGRGPVDGWVNQNTILVGVAQARDIEFDAKYVGDWMLHCHLPHHMMNQMISMVGPISHGGATAPSQDSEAVLSCPHHPEVHGKAGEKCPKCGMALVAAAATTAGGAHAGHGSADPVMDMYPKDDPEKKKVPGYPQDMWMVEDEKYNWKPENYGLRRGWTGGMMGMMTMVRVVKPEVYDKIMELKAQQPKPPAQQSQPAHQHGE